MAVNTSKNSDDYKRKIDKLTSNNHNNIKTDQSTSEKVDPDERDTNKESKMQVKSESIKDKISRKISKVIRETKSDKDERKTSLFGNDPSGNIKSIVLGLFALIGFIILVYSIFVAVMGEPLASVADTVFIAALIASFTLIGTIVSHLFLKK
ncbi:MAG TPA: hypothetical protein VF222_05690 [Nitrososphaeraceae archaeon]